MSLPDPQQKNINFFRPRGGAMRQEVRVITLVLAGWLIAIIGFQLIVMLLENRFDAIWNGLVFFNLPIHYWLTGQLLPLWFVMLCAAFNLWMDRHTPKGDSGALRFKLPSKD